MLSYSIESMAFNVNTMLNILDDQVSLLGRQVTKWSYPDAVYFSFSVEGLR